MVTGSDRLAEAFVEVETLLKTRSTPALELKKSLELKEAAEVLAPKVPAAPKAASGVSKVRSAPALPRLQAGCFVGGVGEWGGPSASHEAGPWWWRGGEGRAPRTT